MVTYGLIGYPLGHSFSKKYFTEKWEAQEIEGCQYILFPIESISELSIILKQHPSIAGLNVTIPYKEQVIPFLDASDDIVKSVGACNCIKISNGRLKGFNTDVLGFEQALKKHLKIYHNQALVLGTGGAAKAVVYVLKKLNIGFKIVSRTKRDDEAFLTYDEVTAQTICQYSLIINTTPVGTAPAIYECPPLPYEAIGDKHYLFDVVYNPAETLFLQKGSAQGALVENGYEMLQIQAEESWRIWNDSTL